MHVFFSGIGGTGIGPLALIAHQAGYTVSGSDKQDSQYIHYLRKHGIVSIHIGQDRESIEQVHDEEAIDWLVYSSAVSLESADPPELQFARETSIKYSKRDEFLNFILQEKRLRLIAVAGTHGKTTTTAMVIWLFKQLHLPVSYAVGAKITFGEMGEFNPRSTYFVYECDEFDRNFLAFKPYLSLISGVSWDHHEIFPTREDYQQAFKEFISQSHSVVLWREDSEYLGLPADARYAVQDSGDTHLRQLTLAGQYNRLDAWLAVQAVHRLTKEPLDKLIGHINRFPGLQRRMEEIIPNLYSDYAHTPEKIRGAMSVAAELAEEQQRPLVVVYEPLTNRRQHYMKDVYQDCFSGAKKVYWLPSYQAREDPDQPVLTPNELISHLADPRLAEAGAMNAKLEQTIRQHLAEGDMVVCVAGGGGGSLDEWVRERFKS